MFLKQLIIKETAPIEKNIRIIGFKNNLNLIVDESDFLEGEKANGIGKTTTLKVIDLCLGAQSKRSLYYDSDTAITNLILKDYITNNKVSAELTVCDNLDNPSKQHILKVDLYPKGNRYIDGIKYNQREYPQKLNSIFFDNEINSPTFRQLIKMFVRVDVSGDNNKFLKFLTHGSIMEYENIYNYLFDLQTQDISTSILEIKESLKEISTNLDIHKKINSFSSIDSIRQRLNVLEMESKTLYNKIDVLVDSKKYKENEEEVQRIKLKYADILNSIDKYEFKITRIRRILEESKIEQATSIDDNSLKELYEDTKDKFSDLNKTFQELLSFNDELLQNKISYFEGQEDKFIKRVDDLKIKQEDMFEKYSEIIMLIESNKLKEYEQLQKRIDILNEEKGKNLQVLETYGELEEKKIQLESDLEKLEESTSGGSDNLKKFNAYFSEYSKVTNDEECLLYETESGFPVAIDNISRNFSTGTRKSVVVAFDLAYQSFKQEIRKKTPNFIIHDVIESIDLTAMSAIVEIINKIDGQYIVAVLNDKLTDVEQIVDSDKVLVLSESERLFKI